MRTITRESGLTFVETLLVLFILGITAAVTAPHLAEARRGAALSTASSRIGGLLMQCRAHAIFHRTATALVFKRQDDDSWRCYLAEDGDGDGVHSDDLEAGRDSIFSEVYELGMGGVGLGILADTEVPDPTGMGLLGGDLSDPIRAGSGNIITFTQRGTASPSSVYLTDHHSRMKVLRILGMTGRARSLEWRVGWPAWKASQV